MLYITLVLTIFSLASSAFAETDPQIKKFEDLFIWKVSDELKLTHQEEVSVTSIIKESNKKKSVANSELENLNKKLKEATTDAFRKSTFVKIKNAHKQQLAISLDELDSLNKAIGLKKLGLYLELKRDLSDKIKTMWIQKEKKGGVQLPPPKIIEEK